MFGVAPKDNTAAIAAMAQLPTEASTKPIPKLLGSTNHLHTKLRGPCLKIPEFFYER